MEAAWKEVERGGDGGGGASSLDPDLQAVWDEQDAGVETLEGVWGRTAAQLEGAEGEGLRRETPYELNAENRFSDLSEPYEEGVRLFEDGQIADAALCFEAEIARNPDNSQVWEVEGGGGIYFRGLT